jgi:hypothetical protein
VSSVNPSPNVGRAGGAAAPTVHSLGVFPLRTNGYAARMLAGFISTTLLIIVVIIAVIIGTIVWAIRKIL